MSDRGFDTHTLLNQYYGTYILYALMVAFIIVISIIVLDVFFPFLPTNPMGGPSAAARQGKTFWTSSTGDSENLLVPESDSPTKDAASYSMTVQFIIGDSRSPSLGKFRHILHRGTDPCNLMGTISAPSTFGDLFRKKPNMSSGHAGIQVADIPPNADPTYKSDGLPQIMNPGLFLDRYKNDLHIFVHTLMKNSGERLMLESTTVEDLPLNQPISISIVCNNKTLEIYVNCRLYNTMILKGTPYLPKHDNKWFGRYCAFPFMGLIRNLTLWNVPIDASDMMKVCRSGAISGEVPAPCNA